MPVNSVTSNASPQIARTRQDEQQAEQAKRAEQARHAEQTRQTEQQVRQVQQQKPVTNTQGQKTGSVVNTTA